LGGPHSGGEEKNVTAPAGDRTSVITMDLAEAGWEAVDWINLAEDRDQWRALVNRVMNFRVT
jgi:hypothetical protein